MRLLVDFSFCSLAQGTLATPPIVVLLPRVGSYMLLTCRSQETLLSVHLNNLMISLSYYFTSHHICMFYSRVSSLYSSLYLFWTLFFCMLFRDWFRCYGCFSMTIMYFHPLHIRLWRNWDLIGWDILFFIFGRVISICDVSGD